MGILDNLFGSSPAQAQPPPQPAAPPAAMPAYPDFYKTLLAAAAANAGAHPTSLWNWLSGKQKDADTAAATASAPAAYQALQSGQSAAQNAQLGTASGIAQTGAMAGVPIDPNNIPASTGPLYDAYSKLYGMGGGSGDASATPIEQQRALYDRMGTMFARNPSTAQIATEFFKLRDQNIPKSTAVLHNGRLVDTVNSNPVTGTFGDVEAAAAKPIKVMETNEANRHSSYQGGVDVSVHSANAATDSAHKVNFGIDTTTGLPSTKTDAQIIGGANFADKNPYFDSQNADLKDLRGKSESADQGLNLGTQIVNAAHSLYTGKGANTVQDIRKLAQGAAQLTGAKLDPSIDNTTSQFEQLKFASQQLVAVASHDLSPRVAQNIYNQIAAVKPGDRTSVQGLRDIIVKQLIPVFQRNKALFGATAEYYKKNPLSNDAANKVPDSLPLSNFGVRDVHSAKPGDYFIDPISGNLRQRAK